ncbi:MAG: cation:proton antiporter [Myxococcaceae bacterium]
MAEFLAHHPLVLLAVQAMLVIAVSRALAVPLRWLGQPLVIAEVVGGIVLGPSLLGWLAPDAFHALFPPSSLGTLGLLSQLGLIFFMFIIGLELEPELLKGLGKSAMLISNVSIALPFGLGAGAAVLLYAGWSVPGVPVTSFALFLGVAMSVTAFPVLARILSERGLINTRVGSLAIACAAVGDVTAWCLLALVAAIVRSTELGRVGLTVLGVLGYCALMWFVARPLLARLVHSRLKDRSESGVSQRLVAFAVVLLFLSAIATEVLGVHALFGAFFFGVIVPRELKGTGVSNLAHELRLKVEDLVVVLLLPLFFAYSGLRTELGLLSGAGAWLTCGVLILVAVAGKFGGATVAARVTGNSWNESMSIGVLMNTRGLMELVILNIGLDLGVISPTVFTMMVVMALVTTVMTSPLVAWLSRQRATVPVAVNAERA